MRLDSSVYFGCCCCGQRLHTTFARDLLSNAKGTIGFRLVNQRGVRRKGPESAESAVCLLRAYALSSMLKRELAFVVLLLVGAVGDVMCSTGGFCLPTQLNCYYAS